MQLTEATMTTSAAPAAPPAAWRRRSISSSFTDESFSMYVSVAAI